jgi:hypothetical protein
MSGRTEACRTDRAPNRATDIPTKAIAIETPMLSTLYYGHSTTCISRAASIW